MDFSSAKQFDLHRRMVRIRLFEEAAGRLAEANKLPGFLHLYVGEEAVASGVCGALNDDDHITSTHRGHGHLVAKGGDFNRMMAELMGKSTGYCKGKGGSMHISDTSLGMLGANGIVGAGSPIAVGAAFANKYRGNDNVAVAYFGDGAANQGQVYESFNMAALWQLPIIYIVENNRYAMGTSTARATAQSNYSLRGSGFGIPGVQVDGMDVRAVKAAADEALEHCRSGKGPIILEMLTYRYRGHSMSDPAKYRTREEVQDQREHNDPIERAKKELLERGVSEDALKDTDKRIRTTVSASADFAENSLEPPPSDLYTDVLVESY